MRSLYVLLLVLGLSCGLLAQGKAGRLSIGVGVSAQDYKLSLRTEWKLLPFVAYQMTDRLSLELSARLPITKYESESDKVFATTGLELSLRYGIYILPRLSVSLSAVGGLGFAGAFKKAPATMWDGLCVSHTFNRLDLPKDVYKRWHAGIRPAVRWDFSERLRLTLSYGFLGVYSHKADQIYRLTREQEDKAQYWGFNADDTFSNGLTLWLSLRL